MTIRLKRALIIVAGSLIILSRVHGQTIINLDLGNNALASNGAGFTKLGIAGGDYAVKNGSSYLWTNVANSGLSLSMTNIAQFGGAGTLDADGFYNISGNGPAYFSISNLPAGTPVTLYACWAWNGASHAPMIFYGGTQITVTNNGEMASPSLATLQNVGTATAAATLDCLKLLVQAGIQVQWKKRQCQGLHRRRTPALSRRKNSPPNCFPDKRTTHSKLERCQKNSRARFERSPQLPPENWYTRHRKTT